MRTRWDLKQGRLGEVVLVVDICYLNVGRLMYSGCGLDIYKACLFASNDIEILTNERYSLTTATFVLPLAHPIWRLGKEIS